MADNKDTPIERYRSGGYGGMVPDERGPWLRESDVLELAAELKNSVDKQAGKWLLARLEAR